jgi:hypothetical protein
MRTEILGVGVQEADYVSAHHVQRAPHRVAFADRPPQLGQQLAL